ncbi:hypothetical protein DPMN_154598 [Dreissena polymorpha]|uniref:Uncharacterized protein n=1 Tax=Dreissena polymorpha TaxID=45954 RepID=A0A9D4FR40_DREPO|nr:hypothetical protein DPMN_154598 [Dreissena polymorpha]
MRMRIRVEVTRLFLSIVGKKTSTLLLKRARETVGCSTPVLTPRRDSNWIVFSDAKREFSCCWTN